MQSGELAKRMQERRAVEAVIWGMPAVNYELMLQEMLTKTKGKVGQVIYWGRPLDWHNQTPTPNPDALYFITFFNTKEAGPVVIEVPPANGGSLNANIVNVWQMPLEDAGLLGADKALQDAIKVEQQTAGTFEIPKWDPASQKTVRHRGARCGMIR